MMQGQYFTSDDVYGFLIASALMVHGDDSDDEHDNDDHDEINNYGYDNVYDNNNYVDYATWNPVFLRICRL